MSDVLLITGQLRQFQRCFDYLMSNDAFDRFQVVISSWNPEYGKNREILMAAERLGARTVFAEQLDNGLWTSIAAQKFSLMNGISGLDLERSVLKTRSDWMVDHDLFNIVNNEKLSSLRGDQLLVHGFSPTIPYFINDGHFGGRASRMRELCSLDFNYLQRFPGLHAEQLFFLPKFEHLSESLWAWLKFSLSTQFDERLASHWQEIRKKSRLYGFVLGEFLHAIDSRYVLFNENESNLIDSKSNFNEIIFGEELGTYSKFTGIKHFTLWDQSVSQFLMSAEHPLSEALRVGYYERNLDLHLIQEASGELEQLIKREEAKFGIEFNRPEVRNPSYKTELAEKDGEISLLRTWVAKLNGSTTP